MAFFAAGLAGVVSVRLPFWADRGLTSLTGATAGGRLRGLDRVLGRLDRRLGGDPEATVKAAKDWVLAANLTAIAGSREKDVNPRSARNRGLTDTTPAKPAAKKATVAAR